MPRARNGDCRCTRIGKPRVEASFGYFRGARFGAILVQNAASALRTRRVPHHSIAAKAKRGYLAYEPLASSVSFLLELSAGDSISEMIPAVAAEMP